MPGELSKQALLFRQKVQFEKLEILTETKKLQILIPVKLITSCTQL